jgi:hypothetical protein
MLHHEGNATARIFISDTEPRLRDKFFPVTLESNCAERIPKMNFQVGMLYQGIVLVD